MPVIKGKDKKGYFNRWGKSGKKYYYKTKIGEVTSKNRAAKQGRAIKVSGGGEFDKLIDHHRKISLSDTDVLKLVEGKARIVVYSDLKDYATLDELLGPHTAIFLLYESKPDYGHWTCVFKRGNDVEFFDSYGGYPDTQLEHIPENFRKISGQDYPHLSALLYESPYSLSYNEHKFQKHGKDINTCGRWSAIRLAFRDWPLSRFASLFKNVHSDDLATIVTILDLDY